MRAVQCYAMLVHPLPRIPICSSWCPAGARLLEGVLRRAAATLPGPPQDKEDYDGGGRDDNNKQYRQQQ
jgi:hypothetical protein